MSQNGFSSSNVQYQMPMGNFSKPKAFTLNVLYKINSRMDKYIQNRIARVLASQVFNFLVKTVINRVPDSELQTVISEVKSDIDDFYRKVDVAQDIKKSRELNTGKQQDFVESIPEYKAALELLPD